MEKIINRLPRFSPPPTIDTVEKMFMVLFPQIRRVIFRQGKERFFIFSIEFSLLNFPPPIPLQGVSKRKHDWKTFAPSETNESFFLALIINATDTDA